jgi:diaminopimelate decarboxylase
MENVLADYSVKENFFGKTDPYELINKYGSPLYVYNENILRKRCREMRSLMSYPKFMVNYSAKANINLEVLRIVRDEGCRVDALSYGEIYVEMKAGFKADEILFVSNNISPDEMQFALDRGVTISVDSLPQLELYGKLNPGGRVFVRFNPGIGSGHHQKVVTGGKKTKFGVDKILVPEVKQMLKKYDLKLIGINQHIGSDILHPRHYVESMQMALEIAKEFDDLEYVDLGGGFGIPYRKQEGQQRLDLQKLGADMDQLMDKWVQEYGKQVTLMIEPGRYIAAECGILLGQVYSVKHNYEDKYVGTDLGFHALMRPMLYDSYHELEIYRQGGTKPEKKEEATIVGNICESGDIVAQERKLPEIFEGDIIGVMDVGAYGHVMSSTYNSRLRPPEVVIRPDGSDVLTRKRDSFEDLIKNYTGATWDYI